VGITPRYDGGLPWRSLPVEVLMFKEPWASEAWYVECEVSRRHDEDEVVSGQDPEKAERMWRSVGEEEETVSCPSPW